MVFGTGASTLFTTQLRFLKYNPVLLNFSLFAWEGSIKFVVLRDSDAHAKNVTRSIIVSFIDYCCLDWRNVYLSGSNNSRAADKVSVV